jgi:hypothetical protein
MVKREIVALCMESPLYFTMPLSKRLELVKSHLDVKSSCSNRREDYLSWIKTGYFNSPDKQKGRK